MLNRADLQQLADVRLAEAAELLGLALPKPDGAYYLAGYAVECALKACIAKTYNQYDWPEKEFVNKCHTHDLRALLVHAQLVADRATDSAANPILGFNWSVVDDWNERSRYERHSQLDAERLVKAIGDPVNGVLQWIKARW